MVAFNDFGTVAYTAAADTLDLGYAVGVQQYRFTNAFLEAGGDTYNNGLKGTDQGLSPNTHIVASTNSVDPTLGDGIIRLKVIYRIVDFS